MGVKIAIIFAIHAFAFLISNVIFSFKDSLVQRFLLNGTFNVQSLFGTGSFNMAMLLGHLRTMFLIFAGLAFCLTTLYYLYYESKSGSNSSRRGMWFGVFAILLFLACAGSLMVFKLPVLAKGFAWVTTPLALLVTVVPYYLSTLVLCDYDAPLALILKNAFAGKSK